MNGLMMSTPKDRKSVEIPSGNREHVYPGRSSDHRVFRNRSRLAAYEFGPFAETAGVHGQHLKRTSQLFKPGFDFQRFRWVLPATQVEAGLNLSDGDRGEEELIFAQRGHPGNHTDVRPRRSHFRNHIGVQQISLHGNLRARVPTAEPSGRAGTIPEGDATGQRGRPRRFPRPGGNDLRPVVQHHLQKFAEASFGVLNRPRHGKTPVPAILQHTVRCLVISWRDCEGGQNSTTCSTPKARRATWAISLKLIFIGTMRWVST